MDITVCSKFQLIQIQSRDAYFSNAETIFSAFEAGNVNPALNEWKIEKIISAAFVVFNLFY